MHADAESEPQDTRPPKKGYTFKLCFSCLLACQCGPPCPPAKDFHLALSSCRWGGWRGRHLNRARSLQAGYKRKRRHYVHACNCPLPSPIGSRIHVAVMQRRRHVRPGRRDSERFRLFRGRAGCSASQGSTSTDSKLQQTAASDSDLVPVGPPQY